MTLPMGISITSASSRCGQPFQLPEYEQLPVAIGHESHRALDQPHVVGLEGERLGIQRSIYGVALFIERIGGRLAAGRPPAIARVPHDPQEPGSPVFPR